ncbi:mei2-like protein [Fusarium sp. NRRL 52700]|nr:mei2-like protein [Fusarium sp. NRRL 52700]
MKFKLRKLKAKFKVRRLLKKDAAADSTNVAHEERLAQVHRVSDGTEHKIERSMDVMVAARRSIYGADMLPRTVDFGVTAEEARELHKKQQDGGIWDGSTPGNNNNNPSDVI